MTVESKFQMSVYSEARSVLFRKKLINQLLKHPGPAAELAGILQACTNKYPCRSAACPLCRLAFQQAAVEVVNRFLNRPAQMIRDRMHAITIVPSSGCIKPNELLARSCKRVGSEILSALTAIDWPPVLIGLDVSFNEDTTKRVKPHWSVHAHGVGLDWVSDAYKKRLRAAFPKTPVVTRPIHCEPLDEDIRGRLYAFKPERIRRVTEISVDRVHRRPCRDSRRRELRTWQKVRLAVVEHRLGYEGRLLIHSLSADAVWKHLEALGWNRGHPQS